MDVTHFINEVMGKKVVKAKKLLKARVEKSAIHGGLIAILAVVLATLASAHFTLGSITIDHIIAIQSSNSALWILDVLPFIFMYWGQHTGMQIMDDADTMITEQTSEVWNETQALREQIMLESLSDPMTKLANTQQFLEHTNRSIQSSEHRKDPSSFIQTLSGFITREHHTPFGVAVLLMDIDNFKEINNTLGSNNGDLIIKEVGHRLKQAFTKKNTFLARVGGDDFSIVITQSNESAAIKVAEKVRQVFRQPFEVQGISLHLEFSIGISMYPSHGNTAKELLQHAEIAMYACKKDSLDHAFYNPSQNAGDINDLILKTEINRAFDNHELCLFYQPKLDTKNQVTEVEALIRWQHPEKGLIPPDTFIPIIIKKRMNSELLQRILDLALHQAKAWLVQDIHLRIALNLTSFDLLDPQLAETVSKKLETHLLTADILKFELTETTLVENQALTTQTLNELEDLGIATSIDDFGTGYSSLAYLSSLPISEVKIDMSFVKGLEENPKNAKIIQAINALAHSLSLKTVAEGVEDAATMKLLRQLGCDYLQGYYISKPLDSETFTRWITQYQQSQKAKLSKQQ